jgi:integrase
MNKKPNEYMATISYHLRFSGPGTGRTGSLCLRVIHRRRSLQLATPWKLYADEWDGIAQHVVLPSAHGFTRDAYVTSAGEWVAAERERLYIIISRMEEKGPYTCRDIIDAYRWNLNNLVAYSGKLMAGLERDGRMRTMRAYGSAVQSLLRFTGERDLALSALGGNLLRDYELSLVKAGLSLNTVSFYMRNLRAIYNKAVGEGYLSRKSESPFTKVYTGVQKTRKRALTIEELRRLKGLELPPGSSLYTAWRLFFFCFYARGMSFVDMAYLRTVNISGGVLAYRRQKTGQRVEITLTPVLKELIGSFCGSSSGPYMFPVIRDSGSCARRQYESALRLQNLHLKELSRLAGLQKPLTTHVTRHSWASAAKHEQVPLWVISEGLGHNNEKTTYTYLSSFGHDVLDRAEQAVAAAIDGSIHIKTGSAAKATLPLPAEQK